MKAFEEATIGDLIIRNRFVMAPMCMKEATEDGKIQQFHYTHYQSRGYGGVGLIVLEATAIEPRGRITDRDLGIWNDSYIDGFKPFVEAIHDTGAKVGIQLAHAGRKTRVPEVTPVAPSAIDFDEEYESPKALRPVQIQMMKSKFMQAARRAKEAGFDFIEIHAAHGYLINQFLSPLTNQRSDEYGGSFENRIRFLREIIEAIKTQWDGALGVRLSCDEYAEGGNHIEDYEKIVDAIKDDVDVINVSSGGVVNEPVPEKPGYQLGYSKTIRSHDIKTIGGGHIFTSDQVRDVFENEQADFVYLGRALLRNPHFILEMAHEDDKEGLIPAPYQKAF
jgi:NADPH2 dehydrogenase